MQGESEDFKFYFKHSSAGKLSSEVYSNATIEKFNRLLVKKNLLLKELTLKTLENGNYDEFLSEDEIHDLKIILKSEIFNHFDKLYFKFKNSIKKYKDRYIDENGDLDYNGKLVYGGLGEEGFIPYKDFLKDIKKFDFSNIKQDYLREYFEKFQEIFLSGTNDYDDWLELAKLEMKTWQNKKGKLAIIGSMESYDFNGVLIEPELEIFIKRPLEEYANDSGKLSEKYFGDGYNMENTKYSSVEPIISSGVVSYKSVLGKNFHNDKSIKKDYGEYGYSIESRMKDNSHKIKEAEKVFGKKLIINNEEFSISSINHTWQHEFGHNLFKTEENKEFTKKCLLEENKANLFSLLYTYEKIINDDLSENEILKTIEYLFSDEIIRFKNIIPGEINQYILSSKLQIQKMFDNGVVDWGEDGFIKINTDIEKLKNFYEEMKNFLFITKKIYENEDSDREKQLIIQIEKESQENVEKIVKLLRK